MNHTRPHSSNGYKTPFEKRTQVLCQRFCGGVGMGAERGRGEKFQFLAVRSAVLICGKWVVIYEPSIQKH